MPVTHIRMSGQPLQAIATPAGLVVLALLLLCGCGSLKQAIQNRPCTYGAFDVVQIDLARHKLEHYWRDADGKPLYTLERARAMIEARGDSVVALTNAGIYTADFTPLGLLVQEGKELRPLNLRDGYGNFYLKPSGVFYLFDENAGIVRSGGFPDVRAAVTLAIQSGPLLVEDGKMHPAFMHGSANCRLRSGIGVRPDGTVHLVISRAAVNFYEFARFFRDDLGCVDALYLDGAISSLYAPTAGRRDRSRARYAGMLAVIASGRRNR